MASGYEMKYRTFDQLVAEAQTDFRTYSLESMIDPQDLVKVARRVNKDLGLRINMTKGTVLEIENHKAKLPDDFYTMNHALICGKYNVTTPVIQGTQTEEIACPTNTCSCNSKPCSCLGVPIYITMPGPVDLSNQCPPPPDPCAPTPCSTPKPSCMINKCGDSFQLIQTIKTETRTYSEMFPLRLRQSVDIDCECPNLQWVCINEGWVKDGWLHTSFKTGKVYINYQGMLQDDEGNLMVPDHEILNEYYEYAMKERICENLWFSGEDMERKLGYLQGKLKMARNNALSIVNMPNFDELKKVHEVNRKAMYQKYYSMFASYGNGRHSQYYR